MGSPAQPVAPADLAGQVRADGLPARPAVGGGEHHLGAEVEGAGGGLRDGHRRHPDEAVLGAGLALAVVGQGKGRDVGALLGAGVPPGDPAAEAGTVDDVRIVRIGNDVVALVPADGAPVALGDRAVVGAAGDAHRAAVLLAGVDAVGEAVVGRQVIELRRRLVVPAGPGPAGVDADHHALVAGGRHVIGVGGVDPHEVVVVAARSAAHDLAGPAAAGAAPDRLAHQPDHVRIAGIDGDPARIIAGERLLAVDPDPVPAAVVGAVEAAGVLRGDHGVEAQGAVLARCRQADPPERLRRPAFAAEAGPGRAAVAGAPDRASGSRDGGEVALPGVLPRLPGGGEEDPRVGRVGGDVHRAGLVVDLQHVRPGRAAVGGAEDAALRSGLEEVAHGRDEDGVGIGGVDPHLADVAGVLETKVTPRPAAVPGREHALAALNVIARFRLAAADVDHVRVRRRDGQGADRGGGPLVEQRCPGPPRVIGPPHPAARRAEHEGVGLLRNPHHHFAPAPAERSDEAPLGIEGDSGVRAERAEQRQPSQPCATDHP